MLLAASVSTDVMRFDRGATGFLDLLTNMNREQLATFQPFLTPAGEKVQLLFASILETAKFATASEITVRENERLIKLGRGNLSTPLDASATTLNQQAIRDAERALRFVQDLDQEVRQSSPRAAADFRILPGKEGGATLPSQPEVRGVRELRDVHRLPDFPHALSDAKEAFLSSALQLNWTNNGEFTEVLEVWDKTVDLGFREGVAGILTSMADSLKQFAARRNTEERGTSPASPLEWWKIALIALYIGAAVFSVFACFAWSACTWVWSAISATAPWLYKIIELGC